MIHSSIPSPPISYFMIGPITVHFYALCILGGIIIAAAITARRIARTGIARGVVLDVSIWAVVVGIIGGRLYDVVTHPSDYFYKGADLWTIFAVWDGGLAIFGSILFGTLGIYIGCRRTGIRFFAFADALAPGLLFAQAFGRLGNYFNQELYGPPTTLPWGLQIHASSPAYPAGGPAARRAHCSSPRGELAPGGYRPGRQPAAVASAPVQPGYRRPGEVHYSHPQRTLES
jgi:prolipoprotein diacylglyceryl transferase